MNIVLRRIIGLILVLSLICVELPIALAETVADAAIPYRLLVRGERDGDDSVDIVMLQNRLIELGYLRSSADGVYGAATEDAVAAFQRSNNLEETGQADPALQQLLYSGAELITASNSTDPQSVTYRVQEKLAIWGFLTDAPDGKAGSNTQEAVSLFKDYLSEYEKSYPTPTATPTPASDGLSGFSDAAIAVDQPLTTPSPAGIDTQVLNYVDGRYNFEIYQGTLSNGDENNEVLRLQRRLYALKYLAVVDGLFGPSTERALLYFQKKNGLNQTAVADEATQRMLFSAAAVESEEYVNAYKLFVDISDQRVYVYQWNGSDYGTFVGEMICSTGLKSNPTPLGTYQMAGATGTGEWYWFDEYECYAKWATRIVGGVLFHSVIYSRGKVLNKTSVKKLGQRASHGCIRLKVEHAQWIYENCASGTTVVIQE